MAKNTSFYYFLVGVLKDTFSQNDQAAVNGLLADINDVNLISSRENMPTIFYLLTSMKDKKTFLERVVSKFNAEMTHSNVVIRQEDIDLDFLTEQKENSYLNFFNNHFSECMSDSELSAQLKNILEKIQPAQLNNNQIIDDSTYDQPINKNSFCYYLAETVKEVFFQGSDFHGIDFQGIDFTVTLQCIKNFIESLQSEEPEQEKTRRRFIQTLCKMYKADEKKPKQNSNDNTDRLFLELVECKNLTIFLNNYLPLSKDDDIQSPIYTKIGQQDYPVSLEIENKPFSAVKVFESTKPTIIMKEIQEEQTSFYQLLRKLAQEISQKKIDDMKQLINIMKDFSEENSTTFLKELLVAWREKSGSEAARYNQNEDADFLRTAGCNSYTLFLRECFSSASGLQKYLFGAIGAATISVEVHEQYARPEKTNNINSASDDSLIVHNAAVASSGQVIQNNNTRFNRLSSSVVGVFKKTKVYSFFNNRNLSPEEKFQRFEIDKKGIRVGVKKYIFARYICKTPKEDVPLKSIGKDILIEGGKKALGLICTPIKAAFYAQKIVNKIFDVVEQKAFEKQYVDFFEDVGDLACNKAIENVLKRVGLIMQDQFKQLNNNDYIKVVRYLSNKMAQGFDSINYSLIDSNNEEFKTAWKDYSQEEKLIEMERILFLCIFEPVKGQYPEEDINFLGVSHQVERFMARAPLKFANDEKRYPRERDGTYKVASKNYTYKGPAFNGDVYLAAKECRDLAPALPNNSLV